MIRILDRLVAGSFFKLFLGFVFAAPILFVLGDVTERLDNYMDRGLTGAEVAWAYLLQLPQFVLWSFPIAALIAAVFTVHSMTVHREVVAAKAGGISFHRLILPLVLAGVLLTGVALALTELVPRTNRKAAEVLRTREVRREWRADFVYQTEDGQTLSVRRLTAGEGRITGLAMEDGEPGSARPSLHVVAAEALWDSAGGWTFYEGQLRQLGPEGHERTYAFTQMRTRGLRERPEELLEDPRDEEEMTYAELGRLAAIIERSGGQPGELLVKKEQKIAIPVATLVIILFGAPLATTSKRGGAAFGVGISVGSTILYLMLLRLSGALGATGALPPLAAAWLPNALFFLAGVVFLARVRT